MDYQQIIVSIAKFAVFLTFITAVIEVLKAFAARGLWKLTKELVSSIWSNSPLSTESVKILNFLIALLYCRVFNYGIMSNILNIDFKENHFASFLDYFGTASMAFMGAAWLYDQIMAIKTKYTTETSTTTKTSTELK